MKPNLTPELNQKWWSKNKPKLAKKTGLGAALKDYQIAADAMDYDKTLKALSELKKTLAGAVVLLKGKHDDTVTVLKKYPKIILAEETRIKKLKGEAEDRASNASAAPVKQKVGKDVIIWKRDISAEIKKKTKPDWMGDFKGFELAQQLNDDILDVFESEGDYVTPAKIAEDSEKMGQKLIAEMVAAIKKVDDLITSGKLTDPRKAKDLVEGAMKAKMTETAKKLEQLPDAYWKKFVAQKKEYKAFKIKSRCKVGLGVFGVVVGTGGLILGVAATAGAIPSMGGSLALGVAGSVAGFIALCRSTAALAKAIQTLNRSAEKTQKALASDLNTLKSRYENASKAAVGATEVGASTLKGLLGADAPYLSSISKCNDAHGELSGKTSGLAVEQRKMSKALLEAMGKAAEIEKELKKSTDKAARKLFDKLVKARASLSKALDKCSDLGGRLTKIENALPNLKKMLDALNAQNPQFAKIFDKVFPVVVSGILIVASAGTGFADSGSAVEFAITGASLGIDIGSEIADALVG